MKYKVSNVCQLLDKSKYPATTTKNGVTFTNNGDGSYTLNGTVSIGVATLTVAQVSNLIVGHKYYSSNSEYGDGIYVETKINRNNASTIWVTNMIREWAENDTVMLVTLLVNSSKVNTVENAKLIPQLFDLTEMYGAGNEPTTVAQFRQDFPDEYYEYSPECWKNIRRLKYVTETKNLIDKNTVKVLLAYISLAGKVFNPSSYDRSLVVPCKPNTTYTVSKSNPVLPTKYDRLAIAETSVEANSVSANTPITNIVSNGEPPLSEVLTITTTSTAKSLVITVGLFKNDVITSFERVLAGVQLELGSTATPYQPYGYLEMKRGKYVTETNKHIAFK